MTKRFMTKPVILPLLGALLACNGTLLHAKTDDEAEKKQKAQQHELSNSIQIQILSMDVNRQEKYLIDFNFSTFHSMYAYRELMLWAQTAPQPLRDDLMTMTRSGLEAAIRDSGMGIPLPGEKGKGQPVGLLFGKGLPFYAAEPDLTQPATLKWNTKYFEREIGPESVGQSLAAKSFYVQADTSDEGKKLGELILLSSIHEFQTLLPLLELGVSKGIAYMPARLKLENDKWTVVNATSQLYGQMSLIQGLARLHALLSSPSLDENKTIAGKRVTEWRKDVRSVLEKVYQNTVKLHLDNNSGSFASSHDPAKGISDRIRAEDVGFTLDALADLASSLQKNDPLRDDVIRRLSSQADYLMVRLEGKTSVNKTFMLKTTQSFGGIQLPLDDQLTVISGLLAAGQTTSKEQYGKTALTMFNSIRDQFWCKEVGILRSAVGVTVSAYDGHLLGLNLATWRRLEKLLPPGEARQHGDKFIDVVLKKAGLQISEGPSTGEPKQPDAFIKKELPQLLTEITAMKKEERGDKIHSTIKSLSDQDGDGVPGIRFGANPFGAAPVIITQTSIKTPFDPPATETPKAETATPTKKE